MPTSHGIWLRKCSHRLGRNRRLWSSWHPSGQANRGTQPCWRCWSRNQFFYPTGERTSARSPGEPARNHAATSCVAHLWGRFADKKFSAQASDLVLPSWRRKLAKTYDSLFKKWDSWCSERDIDPISGDIAGVVNFLADLFHQGYQHRSLCNYRSAISSVHDKVDGYEVGSHPMVRRLLKGSFHERPTNKILLYLGCG